MIFWVFKSFFFVDSLNEWVSVLVVPRFEYTIRHANEVHVINWRFLDNTLAAAFTSWFGHTIVVVVVVVVVYRSWCFLFECVYHWFLHRVVLAKFVLVIILSELLIFTVLFVFFFMSKKIWSRRGWWGKMRKEISQLN